MKSIKRRFDNISKKEPSWSSYTCFIESIRYKQFSKNIIHKWFNTLVDTNDYDKTDKRDILHDLVRESNCRGEHKAEGKHPCEPPKFPRWTVFPLSGIHKEIPTNMLHVNPIHMPRSTTAI